MRRIKLLPLLLAIFFISTYAQEKLFTVEDVVFNSYRSLAPARMRQLEWFPNSTDYVYQAGENSNASIVKARIGSDKTDTLITLSAINKSLEAGGYTALNFFPMIRWIDANTFSFTSGKDFYRYNLKNKSVARLNSLEETADNETVSPDGNYVAYTKANNLFVSIGTDGSKQISFDADTNIVNGQAVHRNEFGINGGIFWSPNSDYIAYYRMDQTMVTDYPLVDITFTPARLKNIKYPMAGQASHHVTIGIYSIKTGGTVWLKTGEPLDQYYTCLTWSPDEKYFYVAHLNRDQNHMQLKKYDASSGDVVKILFEEKNDKFVEPQNQLIFLPGSSNRFLWFSERDGWNHLYLYDIEGNLLKQVTKGSWLVTSFDGFDKKGKNIFVTTTAVSPLERHFYSVNLESGKMKQITSVQGTHNVSQSSDEKYFIDSYTSMKVPRVINILDGKGKVVKNLLTAPNPLAEYKLGEVKVFTIKNNEGTELYCRTVYPPDFDPAKKYPVIVYVYGGPHDQEITDTWGGGRYFTWFYMMAQKGYICFTLDNRGSANRGLGFAQATFRHLGTKEVEDQMAGVNYLKSLPYVDENRFGVYGWSYGGFMTTSLMLRTNNAFKVGACGGAVIDWKFYEVMYTERYMDTPQTNPEGFKEASLLNYVDNLKGKLLLVHGTSDPTVVWQNTLSFAKKAADLNKPLDYYPYPGHQHGISGQDALHLYYKITNYFIDNL